MGSTSSLLGSIPTLWLSWKDFPVFTSGPVLHPVASGAPQGKENRAELGTKSRDNNAINKGDKSVYTYCKQSCIATHHIQNKCCFLPLSKKTRCDCHSTNNSFLFHWILNAEELEKKMFSLRETMERFINKSKLKGGFTRWNITVFTAVTMNIVLFLQ